MPSNGSNETGPDPANIGYDGQAPAAGDRPPDMARKGTGMATWSDLQDELDRWHGAGITPTLWWRDDDARAVTAPLEQLLQIAGPHHVPVHLAVIPGRLQPDLADRLGECPDVYVMQHGFAHVNHEPPGHGASEFGQRRDMAQQCDDLRAGWRILEAMHLPNLLPGVVPPWNRMSQVTLRALPALGYRFFSAFEGPTSVCPVPGLLRFNAHVDPVRWREGQRFRGTEATLERLLRHLTDRREGRFPLAEPTGLLTHHLTAEPAIWSFVEELLDRSLHRGRADWISLATMLDGGK